MNPFELSPDLRRYVFVMASKCVLGATNIWRFYKPKTYFTNDVIQFNIMNYIHNYIAYGFEAEVECDVILLFFSSAWLWRALFSSSIRRNCAKIVAAYFYGGVHIIFY